MLFPGKCFNFGEKYNISGKFLGISGNFFSYLGKNVVCPENFFKCPFFGKVPFRAWPPNFSKLPTPLSVTVNGQRYRASNFVILSHMELLETCLSSSGYANTHS